MQNLLNRETRVKIIYAAIYILIALVLAFLINYFSEDFTFNDALFMIAIVRFFFNVLGILNSRGAYDSLKKPFKIFNSSMRKNVPEQEVTSTLQEYAGEDKVRTSTSIKIVINLSLVLVCFATLYF